METSRNPYMTDQSQPALRRSVVAYIDILGYREMACRAEKEKRESDFLRKIYQALGEGQKWLKDEDTLPAIGDKDDFALKAFTDNVVIGYPIGIHGRTDAEIEMYSIFLNMGVFQLQMTKEGFFVRGAISVGDVYIDDIVVFGNAFTEAYNGESQLARDPRIILNRSAVQTVKEHLKYYGGPSYAPQYHDIYRDSDGQWFLNYLDNVRPPNNELPPDYCILEKHKQIVEKRLNEFMTRPEIWSKYFWTANYHNFFCSQYPEYFEKSHMVDLEKFRLEPSRIT